MSAPRSGFLAGATLVAVLATLRAQTGALTEASCDPLAPPARAVRGVHTLYGEMRVERGAPAQVQRYATLLLPALAYRFALPSPLKLAVWGGFGYLLDDSLHRPDSAWVYPDLPLGAFLIINKTGTLRRLVLVQSALVPAAGAAVLGRVGAAAGPARLPAVLIEPGADRGGVALVTSSLADC